MLLVDIIDSCRTSESGAVNSRRGSTLVRAGRLEDRGGGADSAGSN